MNVESYNPVALILTDAAIVRIREVTNDMEEYLRLGLRGGGCSGFEFFFELNKKDDLLEDDTIIERDKQKLVVDAISMQYLVGSTVDFKIDLSGAMFIISSPLSTGTCGCGVSMSF